MLKGGNISEPKEKEDTEEEEGEEEEGEKKAGDEEEKEDPKEDDDSSNRSNSNMTAVLARFDLDLTHVLTIVCGFERNSNPVKAVKEFGFYSFVDFRSSEYDHKWQFEESNTTLIVTGHNGIILSAIIAYA